MCKCRLLADTVWIASTTNITAIWGGWVSQRRVGGVFPLTLQRTRRLCITYDMWVNDANAHPDSLCECRYCSACKETSCTKQSSARILKAVNSVHLHFVQMPPISVNLLRLVVPFGNCSPMHPGQIRLCEPPDFFPVRSGLLRPSCMLLFKYAGHSQRRAEGVRKGKRVFVVGLSY